MDEPYGVFTGIIVPEYGQVREGNVTGIAVRNHARTDMYDPADRAVTCAKADSREKIPAGINDPKGRFVQGNLFVRAEDFDGTVLADLSRKEGIGKNRMTCPGP